jgi:hypothetical protein
LRRRVRRCASVAVVARRHREVRCCHVESADVKATVVQSVAVDRKNRMVIAFAMAIVVQRLAAAQVRRIVNVVLKDVARKRAARKAAAGRVVRRAAVRRRIWKRCSFGLITMATTC